MERSEAERKSRQKGLEESEAYYRELFEHFPISVWEEDFSEVKKHIDNLRDQGTKDFRAYFEKNSDKVAMLASMVKILNVNKTTLDLYKAQSKESFINSLDEVFCEESYEIFKEELIAIAQGKTVFESEAITQTLQGNKIWINLKWSVAPGFEQSLSRVFVSIIDITRRKEAEAKLKNLLKVQTNSAKEWQLTFDAALDIIALISPDYRFIKVNKAGCEAIGRKQEELIGKKCYEIIHGLDHPIEGCPCAQTLKTKRSGSGEVRDHGRQYIATASPVFSESNELVAFVHTVKDITERTQIEEKLKMEAQLLDNATDSIVVHDLEGNFIYVNEAACKYRGYTKDEMFKMNLRDLMAPEHEESYEPRMKQLMKAGQMSFESINICKDGSVIPLEVHSRKVEIGGKKLVFSVARDITERKKAEQQLRESYERVKQTKAQLVQSSKMAAMGTLGAGIAHQLSQPLSGIRGFTQAMLMEMKENNPLYKDLKKIEKQTSYMKDIIDNIKSFSKKSEFRKVSININEPLEKALQLMTEQLRLHNIRLIKELDYGLPSVYADANQMQQVFVNFIVNAREALDSVPRDAKKELFITTRRAKKKGKMAKDKIQPLDFVEIVFSDTGPGISSKLKERVFEPFFTTKGPHSIGLGLFLSYRIVEDHGGSIEIDCRENGVSFKVILPTCQIQQCWNIVSCPPERRDSCPAYIWKEGYHCWEIAGTYCNNLAAREGKDWREICEKCDAYKKTNVE